MNLNKYGKIVKMVCCECFDEALQQEYENNKPDWLSKEDNNEFTIRSCAEYKLWYANNAKIQPCFVILVEYDYGSDELLGLCSKHLIELGSSLELKNEL